MALPVPLSQLRSGRRQEAGKIKIGEKGTRGPKALDTFRFTSGDALAIAQLAEKYGGLPKFKDGKHEVITDADEIDVVLPPDALNGTPRYELWSGGGLQRICNGGENDAVGDCTVFKLEGEERTEEDCKCLCTMRQALSCKPTTMLSVILPGVRVGGVWNLRSGSEAVAGEMTQFIELCKMADGLAQVKLAITKRASSGGRRKYNVPTFRLDITIQELIDGKAALTASSMGALEAAMPLGQLGAGAPASHDLNDRYKALDAESKGILLGWLEKQGWEMKSLTAEQKVIVLEHMDELAEDGDGEMLEL